MAIRIDVEYAIPDARAKVREQQFTGLGLKGKIDSVRIRNSYTIDASLNSRETRSIARMLANPILEKALANDYKKTGKFDWAIEIGFLPGVTDNVANTTKETIEDLLKRKFMNGESVYTSLIYFIRGSLSEHDTEKIADSLYNPLIQRAKIKSWLDFRHDHGMEIAIPRVKLEADLTISSVNLNVENDELDTIGKKGIKNPDGTRRGPLALSLEYLQVIRDHFNKLDREPTDIELESIAQTWSEHCKHTIFANPLDEIKDGLYKSYIKRATQVIRKKRGKLDFCVSVFHDNSGGIEFDDHYLITHKMETHNSPSALDPFGGAITGIVGVNRDAIGFGLGAKPVVNLYGFCLADPRDKRVLFRDQARTQKMLSAERIMQGVIQGVNTGGNCSGIPTASGFLYFDRRFRGKPLVFAGTVGLIPKKNGRRKLDEKRAMAGDYIVMTGGRVGQDGIHGATFSSVVMDSGSPATAVQIGDPITQKKMSDAIVKEARDQNLFSSITDDGAGGLSCSVAEMAKESGGCIVQLEKVPLKYPGLEPWKIWISESQERMTLAVPKEKWLKFKKLMTSRGVEATRIGEFTKEERCVVKYGSKTIMDLSMNFLHDGLPKKQLRSKKIIITHPEPVVPKKTDWNRQIIKMLKRLNLTSYDFISKQYDHEVQGSSIIKPIQGRGRINSEVAVIRPLLSSKAGIVLSYGLNPNYSDLNTYHMAACAIDTAIRGAVTGGADPNRLALLDNFCWSSSDKPEQLYLLKEAAKACFDYAVAFRTPFISGKDSMFNDFKGYDEKGKSIEVAIPPTLLISAIGVIPNIDKTISIDPKFPDDLIYLLGQTKDELGGSEYYSMLSEESGKDFLGNNIPKVEAEKNLACYRNFYKAVELNLVSSAISVGKGGLAVALAKMGMAGGIGCEVSLDGEQKTALFSESQGRIIVTISPENKESFERLMKKQTPVLIGKTTAIRKLLIRDMDKREYVDMNLSAALHAYRSTFKDF